MLAAAASVSSVDVVLPAETGLLVVRGRVIAPPYIASGLGTPELFVNGVSIVRWSHPPEDRGAMPDDPQAELEATIERIARAETYGIGDSFIQHQLQDLAFLSAFLSKGRLVAYGSGRYCSSPEATRIFRVALEEGRQCEEAPTGNRSLDDVLHQICAFRTNAPGDE